MGPLMTFEVKLNSWKIYLFITLSFDKIRFYTKIYVLKVDFQIKRWPYVTFNNL